MPRDSLGTISDLAFRAGGPSRPTPAGIGACGLASLRTLALLVSILAVAAGALVASGCSSAPAGTPVVDEEEAKLPPKPRTFRVTSAFGGVHRRAEVVGQHWFQALENRILVLDARSGTLLSDLELSERGTTGPVSDFAIDGGLLRAVLETDGVVEVDYANVRAPAVKRRWGRDELGIAPRRIAMLADGPYVSGDGGAIRLAEATPKGESRDEKGRPVPPTPPKRFLEGRDVAEVVDADGGPAACVGRRILRLSDGTYLGAASHLIEVPEQWGGGYGFILQASEGAEVGLMGRDFRERSSSALRGTVHAIRLLDDRFAAVNDWEIATWKLEKVAGSDVTLGAAGAQGDQYLLGALISVPVKGARDCAKVQRNRFAVAGSFGRALYRYLPEGDQPGDTFYWSERLPGRLEVCVSDRRRVLASGREGTWLYLIGERAELTDRPIASPDRPVLAVEAAWGLANCDETRSEVQFRIGDRLETFRPSRGGQVSTIALADARVWIGSDGAVDVIGFDPVAGRTVLEASIRISGPAFALYPNRVGGGVTAVALESGFVVIGPVDADAAPVATSGAIYGGEPRAPLDLDGDGKPDAPAAASAGGRR